MVPMHAKKRTEACHEPTPLQAFGHPLPALRGEGRERGACLVHGSNSRPSVWRCSLSMNRPLTPSLSPSEGERVPDFVLRSLGEGGRAGEGAVHGPNAFQKNEDCPRTRKKLARFVTGTVTPDEL